MLGVYVRNRFIVWRVSMTTESLSRYIRRTFGTVNDISRRTFFIAWGIFTLVLVYLLLTIKPINDFDTVREACPNQLIEARAEQSYWGKSTEIKFYCR